MQWPGALKNKTNEDNKTMKRPQKNKTLTVHGETIEQVEKYFYLDTSNNDHTSGIKQILKGLY